MPSCRQSSAMLSSPRRPAKTIRILSSEEYRLRVCLRISLTMRSASSVRRSFITRQAVSPPRGLTFHHLLHMDHDEPKSLS